MNSVLAEGLKIGAVNTIRVLEKSPQAISAEALIKKEFASRDRALVAQQKKTKSMEDRLAKDGAIMSDDEQRKLRNNVKEKQSEFQFHAGKLQQAEQQWREQFFRANMPRIQEILKKIVEEEKVDMVLNGQAVIHVTPDLDLTKKLLNKLNQATAAKK